MKTKRYPFNMSKHQHDIYFRYYKAMNEKDDKLYAGTLTDAESDRYETLIKRLESLLDYGLGVVWLTGKEYGLARETVIWADLMRR